MYRPHIVYYWPKPRLLLFLFVWYVLYCFLEDGFWIEIDCYMLYVINVSHISIFRHTFSWRFLKRLFFSNLTISIFIVKILKCIKINTYFLKKYIYFEVNMDNYSVLLIISNKRVSLNQSKPFMLFDLRRYILLN